VPLFAEQYAAMVRVVIIVVAVVSVECVVAVVVNVFIVVILPSVVVCWQLDVPPVVQSVPLT